MKLFHKSLPFPIAGCNQMLITIMLCLLTSMPTLVAAGWLSTGDLNEARGFHAASLLSDGRVLVTGGREPAPGLILNTAEIYNPNTNIWTLVAPMLDRRNQHESVVLLNGQVLVMGGDSAGANTNVIATAELFNPTTNGWTTAASMNLPRTNFTATRLLNGTVLVVGGSTSNSYANNTASAEIYDPTSNTWSLVASMSLNRRFHSATLLADGRVLVSGGVHWFGGTRTERSAEIYDPTTNTWTSAGSMNIHRESHPSVLLQDGWVLVVGTNNLVDLYNPSTNSWHAGAPIPEELAAAKYALLPSGTVLIAGGRSAVDNLFSETAQIYDPQADSWTFTDPMRVQRFAHTSTHLTDGRVLITGGENPLGVPIQTAEIFAEELGNTSPTADTDGPYSGDEGSQIGLNGTFSFDTDGDPLTYAWGVDTALCSFDNAASATPNLTCTDNGNFTVTLTVDDGQATDTDTVSVTVSNVAPTVGIDSLSPTLLAVGQSVTAHGSFTDSGTNDTHTASWDWGDTSSSAGTVNGLNVGPDSHIYNIPGIYIIELTVTDDDGGVGMNSSGFAWSVVYNPDGGFVTGSGWIDSPADACVDFCGGATGRAHFGFISRYQRGATVPTGRSDFNFKAGNLDYHSNTFDWLVVNQGGANAQFKGSGTINGAFAPNGEPFQFMIWAKDLTPSDDDTFRIRIWFEDNGSEINIYDNGFDQAISGGAIRIQTN